MSPFQRAQFAAARLLRALAAEGVTFTWDTLGWQETAPNEGQRWTCSAAGVEGRGGTGEEALWSLVTALEAKRYGSHE